MWKNIRWIVASLALIAIGGMSLLPVIMLPMMFDAPGSDSNPITIALVVVIAAFPVFCLIGSVLPWIFRRRSFAGWLFFLPVVDLVLIVAAFFALGFFCGGRFAC
jgi:hypothetical protein